MKEAKKWIKRFARFGIFSKGVVYVLIGVLAVLAAFNAGGSASGKGGAFSFLEAQPFGQVLLAFVAVGLIGYVMWRFIQAIYNPEDKKIRSRLGYASSGLFYAFAAFTAAQMVFIGSSGGGDDGSKRESYLRMILDETWGQIAVGIIAAVFFGRAIYHLYRALSGQYADKLKEADLHKYARQLLLKLGLVGYIARAIVIGVIGFLFLRAAWFANSSEAGSTKEAFELLRNNTAGPLILAVVAAGLAAYGIFMIVKARYRALPSL